MGFTCAPPVTRQAVVSYTAFPPLPPARRYISVALALESPPPDVIRHSALWSPDFPHPYKYGRDHLSCLYFNLMMSHATSISRLRLPEISVRRYAPNICHWHTSLEASFQESVSMADAWLISYQTLKRLPPINSRQMELLGTFSLSMPRKYSRNFKSRFAS